MIAVDGNEDKEFGNDGTQAADKIPSLTSCKHAGLLLMFRLLQLNCCSLLLECYLHHDLQSHGEVMDAQHARLAILQTLDSRYALWPTCSFAVGRYGTSF